MVFNKDWSRTSNIKNKMFGSQKRKIASIMSFSMIFLIVGSVVAAVLLSNIYTQQITIYQADDQLQLSLKEQPLPGESMGGIQQTTVIQNQRIKDSIITFYWNVNISHATEDLIASDVSIEVDFFYDNSLGTSYLSFISPSPPTVFTAEVSGVLTWTCYDSVGFESPEVGDHNPLFMELKLTWGVLCPSGLYDVTVFVTSGP